ncbi:MAG: lipoyl(octanoyl) transferase LipB [Bacteroidales bacterium]|nr:lipoyl(octanoyl) transferase LipB [Bacteroidales bacterium]
MNKTVLFEDLGNIDYKKAWDYQEKLFSKIINIKTTNRKNPVDKQGAIKNFLLFCEHPHVYTLGKSGAENNLLINEQFLKSINATYYKINRGGDITYHGPGQIVGYPIFDLENFKINLKDYIFLLEKSIIETLKHYNIKSERLDNSTGVWIDTLDKNKTRKICAIGVRASRYVTMHGFAFNINTDLNYFNHINPCGFVDKGVTSIKKELGKKIDFNEAKTVLLENIKSTFEFDIIK